MSETEGFGAAPPWWAKRIRHGSLLTKRLWHLFTIIMAGGLWCLGDLYNVLLDCGGKAEEKLYSSWLGDICRWLGWVPDKATLFWLLGWLDFVGDVGFFIAVGWSLLWIYSDAVCIAGDSAMAMVSNDQRGRNGNALRIFLKNVLLAAAVAGAFYFFAWQAIKDSGQLRWLLQPNYEADMALNRLKQMSNYEPSWGGIFWDLGFGKSIDLANDAIVASQRVDEPPIWVVELAPESKRLLYFVCVATMCVGSWWLLKNSIRPSG